MKYKLILIIALLSLISLDLNSQCAMCKTVVETNMKEEKNDPAKKSYQGLNNAILYLMGGPYLLALTFGFAWHYQNKKKKSMKSK